MITQNLKNSFPELSEKEIRQLRGKFYKVLGDMFVEALKSHSSSKGKKWDRFRVTNPEILDQYYENQKSCVIMMAHYANWEWIIHGASFFKHRWCSIYKELRNKRINEHLLKLRRNFGMLLYSQAQTGVMVKNNIKAPALFVYISDQNPGSMPDDQHWIPFLGRPTACLPGAEMLARKFDLPVFYLDVRRVSRGRYDATLVSLETKSAESSPGQITEKYMNKLESVIRNKPEFWLWSHKRWKKTPPDHIQQQYLNKTKINEN